VKSKQSLRGDQSNIVLLSTSKKFLDGYAQRGAKISAGPKKFFSDKLVTNCLYDNMLTCPAKFLSNFAKLFLSNFRLRVSQKVPKNSTKGVKGTTLGTFFSVLILVVIGHKYLWDTINSQKDIRMGVFCNNWQTLNRRLPMLISKDKNTQNL